MQKSLFHTRLLFKLIIITLLLLGSSGCWDQVEIQQRAFILGIGIDQIANQELKPPQIQEPGLTQPQIPQLLLTMEIPKLQQMGGSQGIGGGGGGGGIPEKPAWVPSLTCINLTQGFSEMGIRVNRQIFLGHLRVVIIGAEYARQEGLNKILDFLFRFPEIQRQVPIFIANGTAQEVLKIKPPEDQLASIYLENSSHLAKSSSQFTFVTLGDVASDFSKDGSGIIGRVRGEQEEAVIGGMAIIKNWKLKAFLGEVETLGIRLLLSQIDRTNISFLGTDRSWYGVEISSVRRELKPKWNGRNLKLEYTFSTEGQITEQPGIKELKSQSNIKKLQKLVEKYLHNAIQATLWELQQKSSTDAIGLGNYIRRHWPKIWRKLGPYWEREFPKVQISVKVKHKIRRGGVIL